MVRSIGFFPLFIGAAGFFLAPDLIRAQLRLGRQRDDGAAYSMPVTFYRWTAVLAMGTGLLIFVFGS